MIEQGGLIPGLLYRGGGLATPTQPYQRTLGVEIPFGRRRCPTSPAATRPSSAFYNVTAQRDSKVPDNVAQADLSVQQRRAESADAARDAAHRAERQRLDLGSTPRTSGRSTG